MTAVCKVYIPFFGAFSTDFSSLRERVATDEGVSTGATSDWEGVSVLPSSELKGT